MSHAKTPGRKDSLILHYYKILCELCVRIMIANYYCNKYENIFAIHFVFQVRTLHDHLPDSGFWTRFTTVITDDWMPASEAVD